MTTAAYGHRVDQSIAYAYLSRKLQPGTAVEISVFGDWREATVAEEPLYDP